VVAALLFVLFESELTLVSPIGFGFFRGLLHNGDGAAALVVAPHVNDFRLTPARLK